MSADLALIAATSGCSGTDRVLRKLIDQLAADGVRIDLLSLQGKGPSFPQLPDNVRRFEPLKGTLALAGYLRRNPPQVLLGGNEAVAGTILRARLLSGRRTRVVLRLPSASQRDPRNRALGARASKKLLLRNATALITGSRLAAVELAEGGNIDMNRIHLLPDPLVDEELYRLAEQPPDHFWFRGEGPPLIVGMGELTPRKDFETLLHAFAELRSRRPARLLILGDGPERLRLKAQAEALRVDKDVELPGCVANPYSYLARAQIFASTSIAEGSATALVEALALSVPVVATDCPGAVRQVIRDGRYGRLVPVGDEAAVMRALSETLGFSERRDLRRAAEPYRVEAAVGGYRRVLGLA